MSSRWGRLSAVIAPLLLMGACASVDSPAVGAEAEAVEYEGETYRVRVHEMADGSFDVIAARGDGAAMMEDTYGEWLYDDAAPDRHARHVEASRKAIAGRCKEDRQPFLRAYSPIPWTPFVGKFTCL